MSNDPELPEDQREFLLPSDSKFRPDIKCMLENNMIMADKEKHELEEAQRKDKHLRQAAAKKRDK